MNEYERNAEKGAQDRGAIHDRQGKRKERKADKIMKDMRTKDERIQDFNDCMEAIEKIKEFCVTDEAVELMEQLEDILLDYYEPMAE